MESKHDRPGSPQPSTRTSGEAPEGPSGDADSGLSGPLERTAVTGAVKLREVAVIETGVVVAGRYQIEAALGEGGSGTVYRSWDRILGEHVAVKFLHPQRAREKSWRRRLAREVKVARAIRHPNVCRVFELGHADGHWFVTMELATGGSLRDLLRKTAGAPPRPLAARLRDIRELCAGLSAIHAVAITHRDVTPQNVLRMADGRLVLTDFGLAIERDDQTTVHGGTPGYLPPEAARGERSDQRSDVFQLGMIMHEVLTDVRPVWSADGARLTLVEPAPGASAAEEELFRLVEACVDIDPARRPPSAVAVAGRLAAAEVARPMPLVVRWFTRARRTARRHPRLLAVAGVVALLAGVVRTVQVASRPPLCRGAAQQLAGIWDPARTEAVRRAFAIGGKASAGDTFARARAVIDAYASEWAAMYTDACQATHLRGEQSSEVLDLRMACLKNGQGELRALTDLFSAADSEVVSRAVNAATTITPVSRCADVPVLKAVVRPPDDPVTRGRVEELRQGLAEIKALQGGGRFAEAVRKALPLVAEARRLGYGPLLAEALDALGKAQRWTGPFGDAEAALDEAMLVAEASRHDRVLAEAAVDRIGLLSLLDRQEEMRRSVPRAEATLTRIGGDLLLESWIQTSIGHVLIQAGKFSEALAADEKALEMKRRVLGSQHWDVALSLGNVASELHSLGRNAEALAQNQRAIATLEAALGPRHVDVALHVYNRGEILLAMGQYAQARADFERALFIWRAELPPDHVYISYALTGMGLSCLGDDRDDHVNVACDAVDPLERALAIRQVAGTAPELRADTEFALARALWRAGAQPARDRPRALRLAESARDRFPPSRAADRAKVVAALASWSPPHDGAGGATALRGPGRTRAVVPRARGLQRAAGGDDSAPRFP